MEDVKLSGAPGSSGDEPRSPSSSLAERYTPSPLVPPDPSDSEAGDGNDHADSGSSSDDDDDDDDDAVVASQVAIPVAQRAGRHSRQSSLSMGTSAGSAPKPSPLSTQLSASRLSSTDLSKTTQGRPESPLIAEADGRAHPELEAARKPSRFAGLFAAMHAALTDGTELPVTLQDARNSLELVTALYHSAEQRQPVDLPLRQDHVAYGSWLPKALRT